MDTDGILGRYQLVEQVGPIVWDPPLWDKNGKNVCNCIHDGVTTPS